jgi:hypothetical protein
MAGVMTIFEAALPGEDWPALKAAWDEASAVQPEQAEHAWLLRDVDDPTTWCAVTLWRSRDSLEDYQSESADLLPANRLFQALGVMPLLAGFDVVAEG